MRVKAKDLPLLNQIALAGLPEPETEVRVIPGRRFRWDMVFPGRVAVEVQGGTWTRGKHVRGKGYRVDCEKLAIGQLAGFLVVWITSDMIADGTALGLIERALRARGWTPEGRDE